MNVCGIDVSKDTLEIVVRKDGKSQKSRTFENSPKGHKALIKFLKKRRVKRVCLEATGNYHLDVAVALHNAKNIQVMVINPKVANNFAKVIMQRTKTDALDADMLAQYVDIMRFIAWEAPSSDIFDVRAAGRCLEASNKELTRAKNQLHAAETTLQTPDFVVKMLEKRIKSLEKEIASLEQEALKIINKNNEIKEKYELLISVPGIANKTAIKLIGELMILSPDMKAKQWVAHAALYPRIIQSGTSVNKKTRIGKMGNRYIRGALYMSALVAAYRSTHVSAFYQHLVNDNGLKKMQALCAVMRKLLLSIHAIFRTNKHFNGKYFYTIKEA